MGNQGRDSTNGRGIVDLAARGRASRPAVGAPLGPSRTLPTLKRVAFSPTCGPCSGILDKRFGQKADMTPPNLLFLARACNRQPGFVGAMSDDDNSLLILPEPPSPSPPAKLALSIPRQTSDFARHRVANERRTARSMQASYAKDQSRIQLPGHGRKAC